MDEIVFQTTVSTQMGTGNIIIAPVTVIPVPQPEPKFIAWRCEKCGKYHCEYFPVEGCDYCKGVNIARRMGLIRNVGEAT